MFSLGRYQLITLLFAFTLSVQCNNDFLQAKREQFFQSFQEKLSENAFNLTTECRDSYSKISPYVFFFLFDASAKIGNGISGLNLFDVGDFDVCYGLTTTIDEEIVKGKYCMGNVPLMGLFGTTFDAESVEKFKRGLAFGPTPTPRAGGGGAMGISYAYCTLSTCTAADIESIISVLVPFGFTFDEKTCYSKASLPDLSGGAIATIVLLSIVGGLVLCSSLYDTFLTYKDQKPAHEILIAFSVISNGRKLFKMSTNPEQLLCLNGMRALSMVWVIFGHEIALVQMSPVNNYLDIYNIVTDKAYMFLMGSTVSVDTFFTIGGLVTMYTFLKSQDKGVKFNIPMYYLHRYLRLTPVLAVIVLIHVNLLSHLGNGPLWNNVQEFLQKGCQDNWWAGLLYIQNYMQLYFDEAADCVPQSWYLSIDFQLFLLSPLVLYPVSKWPKVGYGLLGLLIAGGIITPALVTYAKDLPSQMFAYGDGGNSEPGDYQEYYYGATYSRFGPYVIGMLFGAIIYKMRKNKLEPKKTTKNIALALCLWLITITGLVACVYGGADLVTDDYDVVSAAFFNGFNRPAWALAVCLTIILCVSGFGGPINDFLSLPIFQFVTKLSYCMYLNHFIISTLRWASTRTPVHFDLFSVTFIFWGDLMYSLALAVLLTLFFESPILILEKYLLGKEGSNIKKPTKEKPEV